MRASIRLLTAIMLIGICGLSIAQGWSIVHFSLALMSIDSLEKRAGIINTWGSAPNVASEALRAELTQKFNISDSKTANSRREVLASILSIEPLSAVNWLSLSEVQLVTERPMERVFESLELSMLSGPNEGYVIAERGIFGVSLWERLSPYLKRRVTLDLAEGEIVGNEKFRVVVSAQPERVRNEIQAAMLATGLAPKEVERRLGF
jgi:hypothetical protein